MTHIKGTFGIGWTPSIILWDYVPKFTVILEYMNKKKLRSRNEETRYFDKKALSKADIWRKRDSYKRRRMTPKVSSINVNRTKIYTRLHFS